MKENSRFLPFLPDFSSFFPIFPDFFPLFPDFFPIFGKFFAVRGGTLAPLATPMATPLNVAERVLLYCIYGLTCEVVSRIQVQTKGQCKV